MSTVDWDTFTREAVLILEAAQDNRITLDDASRFFETAKAITNSTLREDFISAVWEIDGFSGLYRNLIEKLRSGPTEEEMVEFGKSPI